MIAVIQTATPGAASTVQGQLGALRFEALPARGVFPAVDPAERTRPASSASPVLAGASLRLLAPQSGGGDGPALQALLIASGEGREPVWWGSCIDAMGPALLAHAVVPSPRGGAALLLQFVAHGDMEHFVR